MSLSGRSRSNSLADYRNELRSNCTNEMSAFWTFFTILTIGYVVYYAVVISSDLHRQRKAGRHQSEQVFVVEGDSPDEPTRSVEQTDSGFRVSGVTEEMMTEALADAPGNRPEPIPAPAPAEKEEDEQPAPKLDAHGAVIGEVRKKMESVRNDMEEIEPEQSTELLSGMMQSALLHGRPPVDIDKTVIEPKQDGAKEVEDGPNG